NADFAVGLETPDARSVPGTRIDDHKRPAFRVDLDTFGRDHAYEAVIDRPLKRGAADHEFDLVVEDVGHSLGEVLAVLIAALAHHVPKQQGTLGSVGHVFDSR